MNLIPLFVRFEIKADKSPKIPPPKAITQSDLLKLSSNKSSTILLTTLKLFVFSFTDNL